MSEEINVGDKFECIRMGTTYWSTFEIKEARYDRYIVQWPDGDGQWGTETLRIAIGDGTVRRVDPGPSAAQTAATLTAAAQPAANIEIKFEVGQVYEWDDIDYQSAFEITAIDTAGIHTKRVRGKDVTSRPIPLAKARELIETKWWRSIKPGLSACAAPAQLPSDDVAAETIRNMLPNELKGLRLYDAIRQLVQVYVARKCDSDSATTVQELRALVDRMRRERIASVLPPKEEIMTDNEWSI